MVSPGCQSVSSIIEGLRRPWAPTVPAPNVAVTGSYLSVPGSLGRYQTPIPMLEVAPLRVLTTLCVLAEANEPNTAVHCACENTKYLPPPLQFPGFAPPSPHVPATSTQELSLQGMGGDCGGGADGGGVLGAGEEELIGQLDSSTPELN